MIRPLLPPEALSETVSKLLCGFCVLAGLLTDEAALKGRQSFFSSGREARGKHGKGFGTTGVLLLLLTVVCGVTRADEPVYDIDIPSMNAAEALNRFAEQTGAITLFPYDLASTRRANAVRGRYTLLEGLDLLLRGTGLSGGLSNKRVVSISQTENRQRLGEGAMPEQSVSLRRKIAAFVASIFSASVASGQDTDVKAQALEEIIVTAQKREERLQDVPISISVLGGQELDDSTTRGVSEVLSRIPGVSVTESFLSGGSSISVRGVTAPNVLFNGSSPIGFYLDSVPFGAVRTAITPDAGAYDLDRIEVLRGPQGTLYGASAQNGVVRVLTKDANLDEVEFKARALTSATEWSDGLNYKGDMAVNVPIVAGKLAMRAVAGYQDLSGWIDRPAKKDINDDTLRNLRLRVNAQPTDRLSIGLASWVSRSDRGAPMTSDANRFHTARTDEPIETDYDVYGLKMAYDFPALTVTSASSYIDYSIDSVVDGTALQGAPDQFLTTNMTAQVFAQEITLTSTEGERWRWSLGAIYRDAEDGFLQVRRTSAGALTAGYLAPNDVRFLSKSYAGFGELTRRFADGRFELTGGLRHFSDDVGLQEVSRLSVAGGIPPTGLVRREDTFDSTSPRVVLAWHPSSEFTAYTSYAEGFRSGAHQLPTVVAAAPSIPNANPDTLKNYEIGAKGTILDGRLVFDSAIYYMDWQDVQQPITLLINGVFQATVINGESASGYGVDLGVTARPLDALTLDLSFSMNDLKQDSDVMSRDVVLFGKGERLNLSPEYTYSGAANYSFGLGGGGLKGHISLSASYTSERQAHILVGAAPVLQDGDSIFTASAKLGISSARGWAVTLFADNVTGEYRDVLRQAQFPASLGTYDVRQRPRTIGLQFDYGF